MMMKLKPTMQYMYMTYMVAKYALTNALCVKLCDRPSHPMSVLYDTEKHAAQSRVIGGRQLASVFFFASFRFVPSARILFEFYGRARICVVTEMIDTLSYRAATAWQEDKRTDRMREKKQKGKVYPKPERERCVPLFGCIPTCDRSKLFMDFDKPVVSSYAYFFVSGPTLILFFSFFCFGRKKQTKLLQAA